MLSKIILIVLFILSLINKNKSLTGAAFIIFIISLIDNGKSADFIEKHFMNLGMTFLMIWMLAPLIKQTSIETIDLNQLLNARSIISIIAGILAVLVASKGVTFLKLNSDTMPGILIGSIIGVTFLGGVPVGPLIASGIVCGVLKLINYIFELK
ncbi:hypothetical protein CLHOM_09460 [Clostridium homopropionicum DSM 5847]|uniref:UPF0756 membrane protein CLHOM_09460 n=1 Tax=Clostridium homopropionicum DSM 5847 TaxID=1121318 RepID=A0A0L6ZDE1_9CLOT|nr:DUF441 family protein [Clostridium homopropionicum]KOA20803.1 hypothetical protein CLHOM_09460 [Clostridium homopropionicum DSM 5847]SFF88764.1 Uncharacterized membrane protein, DUF441 family [Clostridium homopropionicum]